MSGWHIKSGSVIRRKPGIKLITILWNPWMQFPNMLASYKHALRDTPLRYLFTEAIFLSYWITTSVQETC